VVADSTTRSAVPDLNLPERARRVRVPQSAGDHANGLGSFQFDGKFVIAHTRLTSKAFGPTTDVYYLERCGSKLRPKIGYPIGVSPHLIVWPNLRPECGVMLPSLRRVVIDFPAHTGPEPALRIALARGCRKKPAGS
jgi:hypothetical protein